MNNGEPAEGGEMYGLILLSVVVYVLYTIRALRGRGNHLSDPEFRFSRYPYRMDLPPRSTRK